MGLTFALDVKHQPNARTSEVALGTEYALFSNFALRSGYSRAQGAQSLPTGKGTSAASALTGFAGGLRHEGLRLQPGLLDDALWGVGKRPAIQSGGTFLA